MTAEELQSNFPQGTRAPEMLVKLLEYTKKSGGYVSCDFELTRSGAASARRYMRNDEAAKQLVVFGSDRGGSLYGYWLYDGRALEDAPVVYLNGEGTGSTVLANNLAEFISLLALGKEGVGMISAWKDSPRPCAGNAQFRRWLKDELDIEPPADPHALVEQARSAHPDLQAWIEANQKAKK